MLVLGLDTATRACAVGLVDAGGLVAEVTWNVPLTHAARLVPLIEALLRGAGRSPADLEGLAAGVGPGSYTGVRIGVATVQGLAMALGVPAVGVSTLEAMALGAAGPGALVCPALDARRNTVYAAGYRAALAAGGGPDAGDPGGLGGLEPVLDVRQWPMAELLAAVGGLEPAGPVVWLGDGATRHAAAIVAALGGRAAVLDPERSAVRGGVVAALGRRGLLAGEGTDPALLRPAYPGPTEAEAALARRRGGDDPATAG